LNFSVKEKEAEISIKEMLDMFTTNCVESDAKHRKNKNKRNCYEKDRKYVAV
jgi:hypothetical protein